MSDHVLEPALHLARRIAGIRATAAVRERAVQSVDRDDLVQELLIACWRAGAMFDPERASLRTFLECVIVRRLASAIRAERRRPPMQPLDSVAEFGVAPL